MMTFDAPERNTCTVRRQATSTPLQALVLLNDPQYVEAARVLASRLSSTEPGDVSAQLVRGYRLLTSFAPDSETLTLLKAHYEAEIDNFAEDQEGALQLLSVGDLPAEKNHDTTGWLH